MPLAIARAVQPRRIFVSYSHLDYADARALHMELQVNDIIAAVVGPLSPLNSAAGV